MSVALVERIRNHELTFGVIGVGYVGLTVALELARKNRVVAYDSNPDKIRLLRAGTSYVDGVSDSDIRESIADRGLCPTGDARELKGVDCFIVCVPTPLTVNKQPNLRHLADAVELVAEYLRGDSVVIVESTTYPGTTEEFIRPKLEERGLVCGRDFYLAFSPERIDPGNEVFRFRNTTKVVGGAGRRAGELAALIYRENLDCEIFTVSSPRAAEMSKILENTYRNVNIGLINEFAMICHKMGISIWEVIEAAGTKPFGFQTFYPGPGVGGHCIPIDPLYLTWKVKEYDMSATMIEASGKIIEQMPDYIVGRIAELLNERGRAVKDSRILVLGAAYKSNVRDCRESPAIAVIRRLLRDQARVDYYDPYVPELEIGCKRLRSIRYADAGLSEYDLIVILTDHDGVDYGKLASLSTPVFDTRNALKEFRSDHIFRL